MYPAPVLHRVTEEEFLALPETMERVELLDGEIIAAPSPLGSHQFALGRLFSRLDAWASRDRNIWVALSPLDIRFGPERILQPDISVFTTVRPRMDVLPVTVIPEIVVEVLSGRRSYDRLTKRQVYLEAGVREYWIVDPENRVVEVVTPASSRVLDDVLRSDAAPGLEIVIPELFPS